MEVQGSADRETHPTWSWGYAFVSKFEQEDHHVAQRLLDRFLPTPFSFFFCKRADANTVGNTDTDGYPFSGLHATALLVWRVFDLRQCW